MKRETARRKPKTEKPKKPDRQKRPRRAAKAPAPFAEYLAARTEEERAALARFMLELARHVSLPKKDREQLCRDFENALLYYHAAGVPLDLALEKLDPKNLGGFYIRPPVLWYALDDAAKIYPLSMKHGQMAVFRLSARMDGPVVPELLQIALAFTIKRFPSFATTVKKGFFWHYLDTTRRRYAVEPETEAPCRPLPISQSGSQSFRVLYYGDRISVEYFHSLTDGTGGMVFLKTLLAVYLRLLGVWVPEGEGIWDVNGTPEPGETANEFPKAAAAGKASGFTGKAAVQMSGRVSHTKPCRVLHFKLDAAQLAAAAREKGVTVTAYVLGLLFLAGKYATEERDGDLHIQVPVNMRKFYPSDTVRNFSLYCGVRLPLGGITELDDILPEISRQLQEKGSKAAMGEMLNATARLVGSVRYVPLFIKVPVAGVIYGFLGDKLFSNTLSNLGVVTLPPEMAEHVRSLEFVLGTLLTNRVGCTLVTLGNTATLTVCKLTADPSFEERLLELLQAAGFAPEVEGSDLYAD